MAKYITFDFWNTLFKESDPKASGRLRVSTIRSLLARHGRTVEEDQIKAGLRRCWETARNEQLIDGLDSGPRGQVQMLAQIMDLPQEAEFIPELYDVYTGVLSQVPPVVNDGAAEILEYLAPRYKIALICNTGATPGLILREFMKANAIFKFFEVVVFSDEVTWAKPNPEIFRHTLGLMKGRPEQAVHVGDDPITDVIGAKKSGIKAVWLAPYSDWAVPECDWHIARLLELKSFL
ncbi:MAG: HAD family hydrolase [Acidobacteriota bacterium]